MKRRVLRIMGIIAAVIVSVFALWVLLVAVWIPKYVRPDTTAWHTGDIFFSVGDSWKSVAVRSISGANGLKISRTTPSHCGIVLVDSGKVKLVHESTSIGRIVMETPEDYLRNNGSYCLYVRRPPSVVDSVLVVSVIDSLMNIRVPFDFNFDQSDDSKLYCTEMVVSVMELCGYPAISDLRESEYIYPQDLLNLIEGK